ncbi:MAG: hypothetical protein FJZ90_12465 [Chloroflexi bacterium]|nr:hypothetical protein [Chloroflexota bacterium]
MRRSEPVILAHRGLAGYAPENTLVAYGVALDLGFGIEVDLGLTVDGHIAMIHDKRLERTTSGTGPVGERCLDELRKLDAGSWFHARYADQRVPTFDEMLSLASERLRPPALVALDVKRSVADHAAAIGEALEAHGLVGSVLVIGAPIYSAELRQAFRAVSPRVATAILVNDPSQWTNGLEDDTANWLYIRFIPTAEAVRDAHEAGKRIFEAGPLVNGIEPENWRRLRDVGVDAILTDFPLECRRALEE